MSSCHEMGFAHPVAIGGVGGSGTRVVANLFNIIGYYPGDDLNEAYDNLWFTLFFQHRSILLASDFRFGALVSLFHSRMLGRTSFSEQERDLIHELAAEERLQHSSAWLKERAASFCNGITSRRSQQPWYWKEPNTHVVIDRIFDVLPELRYIHVLRHPLYMSVSKNQNQLRKWGPIFLNQDVAIEPRFSLSYWCAAHRRIVELSRTSPERVIMIDFDSLCEMPELNCGRIEAFLNAGLSEEHRTRFCNYLHKPNSSDKFCSEIDLKQFDPMDLEYVSQLGYLL
jgi:Sulfotransferase family